jgi:flagellar biosynthesis/type III secretory pathway M-ring protein FliF/YscJ
MDFLKNQGQKIREQLAGLTPSQKMLAGSLVIIMLMTLAWWSRYAGSSEMVPLLETDFSDDNLSRATLLLKREQIPYKVVGKRIHVSTDRQFEAIAALGFEQLLPQDTSSAWEQIIERMDSPWNPQSKQDQVYNHAKEVLLGQVLRSVKGIRTAQVVIDNQQKRSFGEDRREPTASVQITTADGGGGGKSGKRLAELAAEMVAGANSGMKRSNVHVIVDGASHTVHDKGEESFAGGAESIMEGIEWGERYYAEKLERHLRQMLPGVMVSVTVDPQITSKQIEKQEYDKSKTFDKAIENTERTEENSSTIRVPAEPGAVPNVGANVGGANQSLSIGAGGTGEGTTNNVTETKTKMQVFPSMVREWIKSPAGTIAVVGASISVPRSHFVRIFKQSYPDAKEPDDEALKPIIDKEMPSIRGIAFGALPIEQAKVQMNMYYDYLPAGPATGAGQPAVATSFPLGIVRGYAKEIALGALAVMSLFMVSMMVRKGTPTATVLVPPERERKPPGPIPATEDVAGEAVESAQTMEAVEIDDHAVRTQQMIAQVQTMVRDNPDAAANLVKRWLNRA